MLLTWGNSCFFQMPGSQRLDSQRLIREMFWSRRFQHRLASKYVFDAELLQKYEPNMTWLLIFDHRPFGKTFLENPGNEHAYPKALLKIIFLCPVWWDMDKIRGLSPSENLTIFQPHKLVVEETWGSMGIFSGAAAGDVWRGCNMFCSFPSPKICHLKKESPFWGIFDFDLWKFHWKNNKWIFWRKCRSWSGDFDEHSRLQTPTPDMMAAVDNISPNPLKGRPNKEVEVDPAITHFEIFEGVKPCKFMALCI